MMHGLPDHWHGVISCAFLRAGVDDGAAFGEGLGEGLLTVDVDAGAQEGAADHAVPVVGQAVHHRVGLLLGEHLAEVLIGLGRGLLLVHHGLGGGVEHALVDVAEGDDLHALLVHELAQVAAAHPLEADADELDAVAGGDGAVLAQRGGGDDGREAEGESGQGGALEE
jgi:hypothetical protein